MSKETLTKITAKVSKEILEAQARGEDSKMIGFRLSGIVAGLEMAGVFDTQEEAIEFIITIKNEFNF